MTLLHLNDIIPFCDVKEIVSSKNPTFSVFSTSPTHIFYDFFQRSFFRYSLPFQRMFQKIYKTLKSMLSFPLNCKINEKLITGIFIGAPRNFLTEGLNIKFRAQRSQNFEKIIFLNYKNAFFVG